MINYLHIIRFKQNERQTIGRAIVMDGTTLDALYECYVLELPWRDNKNSISRIPAGKYDLVKRFSQKYKWHLHVLDVEGRSYILIHPGNTRYHTRGCILPGTSLKDINQDGDQDVINSRVAMEKIKSLLPNDTYVVISEEFN